MLHILPFSCGECKRFSLTFFRIRHKITELRDNGVSQNGRLRAAVSFFVWY